MLKRIRTGLISMRTFRGYLKNISAAIPILTSIREERRTKANRAMMTIWNVHNLCACVPEREV